MICDAYLVGNSIILGKQFTINIFAVKAAFFIEDVFLRYFNNRIGYKYNFHTFFWYILGKKIRGYTSGVFDLFHIGHLNLLRNAKSMCDELIVGVTSEKLVKYKFKTSVIPFDERIEIVRSIKYVDVEDNSTDKTATIKTLP